MFHPEVVGFYYDHGISLQWEVDDFETLKRMHELKVDEADVVAGDPSRVLVTFRYEGDELRLTVNEELDLIEMRESG